MNDGKLDVYKSPEYQPFIVLKRYGKALEKRRCCVHLCSNDTSVPKVTFHPFPKEPKLRQKWMRWCKGKDPCTSFVCSEHFESDDFYEDGDLWEEALPSKKYLDKDIPSEKRPGDDSVVTAPTKKKKPKIEGSVTEIRCSVKNCNSDHRSGFAFYPYPKDAVTREKWIMATRYKRRILETTGVCARHFPSNNFIPSTSKLRIGSVPSCFIPGMRKSKIFKEFSSDEETCRPSPMPEFARTVPKKDRKLGRKIEIVAEFDENYSRLKSSKIVYRKVTPKGKRERQGVLIDCKNSLTLIKNIISGLDITQMQGVHFKPGEIEESRIVLPASGGQTTEKFPFTERVIGSAVTVPSEGYVCVPISSGEYVYLPESFINQEREIVHPVVSAGVTTIEDPLGYSQQFIYTISSDPTS